MQAEKKQKTNPAGKVGKKVGCGICGCIVGFLGLIFGIIYLTTFTNYCARMMGEETYPISGNPKAFDPIAAIPEIRAKVGARAVLVDIDASSVRADGTMNLDAKYSPAPRTNYRFQVPLDKAPEDQEAPPIGAGRGPDDVWVQDVTVQVYQPGQMRSVSRISGGSRSTYTYTNEGMDIDRSSPRMGKVPDGIADITVSTQKMWEIALKLGAPKDAVASINIKDGDSTFRITGMKIDLRWDENGKLRDLYLSDEQKNILGLKEEDDGESSGH